ncbi:MAG TPA: DUF2268 domain-containing putative Zn-dependent protease [Polyangiaceae bacterium]|nr:DUF2268 domain-containing putative Zn-dependent protease [Polyangiaceae bacterium]
MTAPDAAAKAAPGYRIENAMPAFWDFWQQAKAEPPQKQAKLFRELVIAKHPSFFGDNVISRDPTKPVDLPARIDAFLKELPAHIPVMQRVSASITADLGRYQQTFAAHFPDFKWNGRVIFSVSLDAFDGAIRNVDGQMALMFGVDKIAKLYADDANLEPLFHHELFHVYHFEKLALDESAAPKLYQPLWFEGLAVFVAKKLNPNASAKQLTLSDEMMRFGMAKEAQLAREFLAQLDSSDEVTYRDYFRGSGGRSDIPPRMGYYLGMRVAERLGKVRDLKGLAELKDPELRTLVAKALTELSAQAP